MRVSGCESVDGSYMNKMSSPSTLTYTPTHIPSRYCMLLFTNYAFMDNIKFFGKKVGRKIYTRGTNYVENKAQFCTQKVTRFCMSVQESIIDLTVRFFRLVIFEAHLYFFA